MSLKDSWLRINRARGLLSEIYAHFGDFLDGEEIEFPLKPIVNYEGGFIEYVVNDTPKEMPDLGILIGDILHNYRASLDYLWWQFACRKLGRTPTDKEARSIQFPVIKDASNWDDKYPLFKYVCMDDVECLKDFQPFSLDDGSGELIALNIFVALSNRDKHKAINAYIFTLMNVTFTNISGRKIGLEYCNLEGMIGLGTVVGKVFVELKELDVERVVETSFKAYIAESIFKVNILSFLEAIDSQCEKMLIRAAKYF